MNCPKCKTPSLRGMEDNDLPPFFLHCQRCRGFWVAMDRIPKVLEEKFAIFKEESPQILDSTQDSATGLCPKGHGILMRARIEDEPAFYLDRCSSCAGVWFDRGEWQRLADRHLLENIADLWTSVWQRKQRENNLRKDYLDWARERFGEDVFPRLLDLAKLLEDHPDRSEAIAFIRNASEKQ